MTDKEVIEKIKDICDGYVVENDCPFFDNEQDDCVFHLYRLGNPFEWEDGIKEWLNEKHIEPMPELKAGDILLSTTPSEYYIAVASDKLLTARSLMVLDLEKLLRHDQIACIKRWNGTKIETIWRYDDEN